MHIKRTDSSDPDFISLVAQLDLYLAECDGDEHAFYAQYNKIDLIRQTVVAYQDSQPVGCGAIKAFGPGIMEVKRMFVLPTHRKSGIATLILNELEEWARALGTEKCYLETGKRQPEAIALYRRNGYQVIPNYGQYIGVENSVCFAKSL
jgi:GNAT superfamily N-acetyltransferase